MSEPTNGKMVANRRNSLLSTGPRTKNGKARAARNGVRHGVYAAATLIQSGPLAENPEALGQFMEAMRAALQPVGAVEEELADRVASLLWRLRRAARAEAALIQGAPLTISHAADGARIRPAVVVLPHWTCQDATPEDLECRKIGHGPPACPDPGAHNYVDPPAVPTALRMDLIHRGEAHVSREVARTLALLDALQCKRRDAGYVAIPTV